MFKQTPKNIVYCYTAWQTMFEALPLDDCCRLVLPYNAVNSIQQTGQIPNDPPQMGTKSTTTSNHPSTPALKEKVHLHKGLHSQVNLEEWSNGHMLLILNDIMQEACSSKEVMSLFTIHCHHKNISVLFLSQNIFPPGKCARTIFFNCHYIVLFGTKQDKLQVQILGRLIYFMSAY